jgi:hypothetical protein
MLPDVSTLLPQDQIDSQLRRTLPLGPAAGTTRADKTSESTTTVLPDLPQRSIFTAGQASTDSQQPVRSRHQVGSLLGIGTTGEVFPSATPQP